MKSFQADPGREAVIGQVHGQLLEEKPLIKVDHFQGQGFFVLEMKIKGALGDLRFLQDLLQAGVVIALPVYQPGRRSNYALPGFSPLTGNSATSMTAFALPLSGRGVNPQTESRRHAAPETAALNNVTAAQTLEFDVICSLVCTIRGAAVISAALAPVPDIPAAGGRQ